MYFCLFFLLIRVIVENKWEYLVHSAELFAKFDAQFVDCFSTLRITLLDHREQLYEQYRDRRLDLSGPSQFLQPLEDFIRFDVLEAHFVEKNRHRVQKNYRYFLWNYFVAWIFLEVRFDENL